MLEITKLIMLTVVVLLINGCFAKVMHLSIQPGQWIDKLFNWQDKLNQWGTKEGFWNEYRHKSWGGCEICFSRFMGFIGFWVYLILLLILNIGFTGSWWIQSIMYILFFISYTSVSTVINLFIITKLFE